MRDNIIQFNSNIAKGNADIRIAFYANIGFLIEIAQMLEYNLRKLLCYHLSVTDIEQGDFTKDNVISICKKYDDLYFKTYSDKWTLGRLKDEVAKTGLLKSGVIDFLKEINDYRVLIVHKIFQNNIICKELENADYVSDYTEKRLIPMTNEAVICNDLIIKVMNEYKSDLHDYKKQLGIPFKE